MSNGNILYAALSGMTPDDARLASYPATVRAGIKWLKEHDLKALPLGKTSIDGSQVYINVQEYQTRPLSAAVLEAHRKYIDIQVIISGSELMAAVHIDHSMEASEKYSDEKDVEFYPASVIFRDGCATGNEGRLKRVDAGSFAIFDAGDIHTSGLYIDRPGPIRKAVVKCLVGKP